MNFFDETMSGMIIFYDISRAKVCVTEGNNITPNE